MGASELPSFSHQLFVCLKSSPGLAPSFSAIGYASVPRDSGLLWCGGGASQSRGGRRDR